MRARPVLDAVGAEHRREAADRRTLAAAREQRQRMAGADDLGGRAAVVARAAAPRRPSTATSARARSSSSLSDADRVERVVEQLRGRAQRVAREAGERGRLGAAAGDVADEREPAAADGERVVEVAADPVLDAGRAVERRDPPAGDVRQAAGQQARLQRARDVRALGVQARVLDRGAGAPRELLGELDVGRAEAPRRLGADERQRADGACRRRSSAR